MKILWALLLGFGFSQTVSAAASLWDASLQASGRSYVLGAIPTLQGGYNRLLWGNGPEIREDGSRAYMYGYWRVSGQVQSAIATNRIFVELELYPVSLLGFAVGSGFSSRTLNLDSVHDCVIFMCNGWLWRDYARTQFVVGAKGVFLIGWARYESFRAQEDMRAFREEGSGLIGQSRNDEMATWTAILGYTLSKDWNVGYAYSEQRFVHSRNENQTWLVLLNHLRGRGRYSIGAGEFMSSHHRPGWTVSLNAFWILSPSLQLLE